jgi:hypothetical protein
MGGFEGVMEAGIVIVLVVFMIVRVSGWWR